ncbi:AMP-binding protein [Herbaspirillum seropedicae]|uniref:Acyltransferase family protein n=1 Tax=Herbaspirillum seropedicae (strain SmR1) TaxID=757424 RepID=D8IVE2_HERSS|nr:AMP-binding protein [Herbaspirillum seropedicae]ADJ63881.1 acyltransferase family protein [Herbaspirillum seropedicae SmR1]AKN65873.1 acyl-phosphate glycerol 3-phosphate acyltransferase [Herbaspirillum seropedicae]NQE29023.1 acyl-phosphate glycerol 3-phosphate acyltransferase [Herbaspirillum seropedicae]
MPDPTKPSPEDSALDRVLQLVQQMVDETAPNRHYVITPHTSFEKDLALDSLSRVELMLRVGRAFGVETSPAMLSEVDSAQDLLRFIGTTASRQPRASSALDKAPTVGVPDHAQTLLEMLEWHADHQAGKVHILLIDEQHREQEIRYCDLLDDAKMVATALLQGGLLPKQTVALMLPTSRDYLACFFGILFAGGIPVPIYPPARLSRIDDQLRRHHHILSNSEAVFIVTLAEAKPFARMLQAKLPGLMSILTPAELKSSAGFLRYRPSRDDIAFIQYTSGSTGDPKGVTLTHANLLSNVRALGKVSRVSPSDIFVSWLPLYHDMGLIGAWFGSLYHGIPLVLMSPMTFLAQPSIWLDQLSRHRGTISAAPNFAYELCLRHVNDALLSSLDLSCWRLALNGSEPVSATTLASFAKRFEGCGLRYRAMTPVYGLAECSVGLSFPVLDADPRIDSISRQLLAREGKALHPDSADAADTIKVPSCGPALPGHQIRVVDDAGFELPSRCVGRLEFRGPSATHGYYRNPKATANLFHDGWLDSGDYAYLAEGEVYIVGRIKDLIKRGGRNLYPYDLEQAVSHVRGIRRGGVAVFGSNDPENGAERLVIVAETEIQDTKLQASMRRAVHEASIDVIGEPPDDVVFVPPHWVLRTSSGKIRRLACKAAYEEGRVSHRFSMSWQTTAGLASRAVAARIATMARTTGRLAYALYAWVTFGLLTAILAPAVVILQRPRQGRRIAHHGSQLLVRLLALQVSIAGTDHLPSGPHVLVVNHSSYLDSLILLAALPPVPGYCLAAKRELEAHWIIRRFLRGLGVLFVDRSDISQSRTEVDSMVEALKRGENILVFPEGTFTRNAGLNAFHFGAFMAASKANVPLVVAGLRGTRLALRDESWILRRIAIAFEVGEMLKPTGSDWTATILMSANARKLMIPLTGEFDAAI